LAVLGAGPAVPDSENGVTPGPNAGTTGPADAAGAADAGTAFATTAAVELPLPYAVTPSS
jgi:hypothetical protein